VKEILVDTQRNCKMSTTHKTNKQYKITSFRMLYSLVDGYQCVRETYYIHLQGRSWTQQVPLKCWYPSTKTHGVTFLKTIKPDMNHFENLKSHNKENLEKLKLMKQALCWSRLLLPFVINSYQKQVTHSNSLFCSKAQTDKTHVSLIFL